jgi:hypothetical protein
VCTELRASQAGSQRLCTAGDVARLRRRGHAALAGYGLGAESLILLRHEHNTTFRVEADGWQSWARAEMNGLFVALGAWH